MKTTFSLNREVFEEFKANFKQGKYGDKTLGKAFYDEFKLKRSCHQAVLLPLCQYNKREAVQEILKVFHFIGD